MADSECSNAIGLSYYFFSPEHAILSMSSSLGHSLPLLPQNRIDAMMKSMIGLLLYVPAWVRRLFSRHQYCHRYTRFPRVPLEIDFPTIKVALRAFPKAHYLISSFFDLNQHVCKFVTDL